MKTLKEPGAKFPEKIDDIGTEGLMHFLATRASEQLHCEVSIKRASVYIPYMHRHGVSGYYVNFRREYKGEPYLFTLKYKSAAHVKKFLAALLDLHNMGFIGRDHETPNPTIIIKGRVSTPGCFFGALG